MYGENFDLKNEEEIFKINSPQDSVNGPYIVVFKNLSERWAIVALDWDNNPTLGIKWFWGKNGNPISHSYATWFVIPSMLHNTILDGIPIDFQDRHKINLFLNGEISGKELNTNIKNL
jgi:hypothetical protein